MGKASTQASQRYKSKTYTRIVADVPKELAASFKEKCQRTETPQAQVIKKAIEDFLQNK